eukprot:TRINITY_DN50739_c0_g2_i1.p1 TRINITY_DN50739_c0_g2~~TRINITY_DN50739_c0_g2_i1.p1  ORF type:complete len:673 (+),score=174.85 TRINITY_DN50739_c0_g2_i1:354-2372(+)
MRAVAHASFRRLQDAVAAAADGSGTGAPCLVLLGDKEAKEKVKSSICSVLASQPSGDSLAAGEPSVHGDVLGFGNGSVAVVEPSEELGSVEVTELATYLKGLHVAHALVLAVLAPRAAAAGPTLSGGRLERPRGPEKTQPSCSAPTTQLLQLVAEFYSDCDDMRGSFLHVALLGAGSGDAEARSQAARLACETLGPRAGDGSALPEVFCVDAPAEVRRLLSRLQQAKPVVCEPLQGASPLLDQYRAIRQKLAQRRPPPTASTTTTGCAPLPSGEAPSPVRLVAAGAAAGPAELGPSPGSPGEAALPPAAASTSSAEKSPEATAAAVGSACTAGGSSPSKPAVKRAKTTVMVFGKTGAGKSHLANLLVGRQAFQSGDSVASVTNEHSVRTATTADGALTVLDTIGFGDTRLPPETVIQSLRDTALEASTGIDIIFFVLKKERVTPVEQEILAYVTQLLFGPDCLPNLYMVVTHAGRLAGNIEARAPWLREQAEASPVFAAMLALLGPRGSERVAFVENPELGDAEDEDDRAVAEKKRQRALADINSVLGRHDAPSFRHGIMIKAGEIRNAHLQDLRRELRLRIEEEVRRELDKDRGALEQERSKFKEELEDQRRELRTKEEELEKRCEEEWGRMREEFETRARDLAREDLEPLAKDIVEKTETKSNGRRCVVM